MRIEEKHNCLGYFGFGNGISMGEGSKDMYCNGCILKSACWEAHRARVRQEFPDVAARIDEMGKKPNGHKLIMDFVKDNGTEPYMSMMMGNMEDGARIASKMKPKDRGPYTLKYPFK